MHPDSLGMISDDFGKMIFADFRRFQSKHFRKSRFFKKILDFQEKLTNTSYFGELQPRELQHRYLYVKKYVTKNCTAQNIIKIRKYGHFVVQNQRFRGPQLDFCDDVAGDFPANSYETRGNPLNSYETQG